MHPYIEIELENGIRFSIEIMKPVEKIDFQWFNNVQTVADVEKILRERNVPYKKHVSQNGVRFAEPKSWYFRGGDK